MGWRDRYGSSLYSRKVRTGMVSWPPGHVLSVRSGGSSHYHFALGLLRLRNFIPGRGVHARICKNAGRKGCALSICGADNSGGSRRARPAGKKQQPDPGSASASKKKACAGSDYRSSTREFYRRDGGGRICRRSIDDAEIRVQDGTSPCNASQRRRKGRITSPK